MFTAVEGPNTIATAVEGPNTMATAVEGPNINTTTGVGDTSANIPELFMPPPPESTSYSPEEVQTSSTVAVPLRRYEVETKEIDVGKLLVGEEKFEAKDSVPAAACSPCPGRDPKDKPLEKYNPEDPFDTCSIRTQIAEEDEKELEGSRHVQGPIRSNRHGLLLGGNHSGGGKRLGTGTSGRFVAALRDVLHIKKHDDQHQDYSDRDPIMMHHDKESGYHHNHKELSNHTERQLKRFVERHKWQKVLQWLEDEHKLAMEEARNRQSDNVAENGARLDNSQNEDSVIHRLNEDPMIAPPAPRNEEKEKKYEEHKTSYDLEHVDYKQGEKTYQGNEDTSEAPSASRQEVTKDSEINKIIKDNDKRDNVMPDDLLNETKASFQIAYEDNALHLLCRHHPPLTVVGKTIQLLPHLVYQLNLEKQTPLHVACACGASPKVVRLLRIRCQNAVSWQDDRGRTPLHCHLYECCPGSKGSPRRHPNYCCDMGYPNEGEDGTENGGYSTLLYGAPELVIGPMLQVLRELCEHMTPEEMGLTDKFGHIALEVAKYYDCDSTSLAILKEAM